MMPETKACQVSWCRSTDLKVRPMPEGNRVICRGCDCHGPIRKSEAEAIAAWNQRPNDAVLAQAQKVADWWRTQWNDKSATLFGFQQHIGDTEGFRMFNEIAKLLPPKEGNNV